MTSQVVINDVLPRTQLVASANQTVFNANWTADATTDILVYARAAAVPANDQTQLVSSSDYNVEFIGSMETVRITFVTGRTSGDIITISRDTPAARTNLYTNTNFTPSMLNQDFGVLTLVDQQEQLYDQQLAPHYNISCSFTDESDKAIDLIIPILEANQFWAKDPTNTSMIAVTMNSGNVPEAGPFITYGPDVSLANAFDMGTLTNGIMAQTVTSGFSTPYILNLPLGVPYGGSGNSTLTAYALMLGGTTSTGAMQQVSGVGTAGQQLTSQGAGLPPVWSNAGIVNTQYITSSGTYTPSAGANHIIVECIGGGGGSGGCAATAGGEAAVTSGAGGGGYARAYITNPIATTVTIGAGGTAGSAGNNAGGNGGTTSFGTLCIATGGGLSNGGAASASTYLSAGGNAGVGTVGDLLLSGGNGALAQNFGGGVINIVLYGGSSQLVGSISGNFTIASPNSGRTYGGGASGQWLSGAHAASAGATGGQGICIVTEFN